MQSKKVSGRDKVWCVVEFKKGREGEHGHPLLHQLGKAVNNEENLDSAGHVAVWKDIYLTGAGCQDFYQDSGGDSVAWKSVNERAYNKLNISSQSIHPEATGTFYQAGHGGGEYLAARAALYLASVGGPVVATEDHYQAADHFLGSANVVGGVESVATSLGVTKDTRGMHDQTSQSLHQDGQQGVPHHEQVPGQVPHLDTTRLSEVTDEDIHVYEHNIKLSDSGSAEHCALDDQTVPGLGLLGPATPGYDLLGLYLPSLGLQGHALNDYAVGTPSEAESLVIVPAKSHEQNPRKIEVARTTCIRKGLDKETMDKLSRYEGKKLVSTALEDILVWRKFLVRQRQQLHYLALTEHSSVELSVTVSVDDISYGRCLNDTSRAITAKLTAERLLLFVGLVLDNQVCLCVINTW